jgi:hypothetical protein
MDVVAEIETEHEPRDRTVNPPGGVPAKPPALRGRPWVKGQSGNPAGRPRRRAHVAAAVANGMVSRKAILLTNKVLDLALAGDKTMLRLCYGQLAPPRREMPFDLQLPPIAERADLKAMMKAVADAAARGGITAAQADALVRMLKTILYWT